MTAAAERDTVWDVTEKLCITFETFDVPAMYVTIQEETLPPDLRLGVWRIVRWLRAALRLILGGETLASGGAGRRRHDERAPGAVEHANIVCFGVVFCLFSGA